MSFLLSLLPATLLAVLGYIVLYCSIRADGGLKTFGRVLAIWVFVLAALPVVTGAYLTAAGIRPFDQMMEHMSVQK
jgi:hypothetical protein